MCGEYLTTMVRLTPSRGSPPHVWRILQLILPIFKTEGITSTCVENTPLLGIFLKVILDHLHMCGEYFKKPLIDTDRTGSPPHVWRILIGAAVSAVSKGITSTCVENTNSYHVVWKIYQDHLHMCGEYRMFRKLKPLIIGSPPHVWRIPQTKGKSKRKTRITSTCVENTLSMKLWDKIRVGSPPHVWRIHLCNLCSNLTNRITSTCVENTTNQRFKGSRASGSPPHVWRILSTSKALLNSDRITSTCVENTLNAWLVAIYA